MQSICEKSSRVGFCVSRIGCNQSVPVRYRRKPSWLGFPKSKEFRVPPPKNWTKGEFDEMFLLQQHHDTYMKSLSAFQEKLYLRSVEESTMHAREASEEAEIGKIIKEIERDNAIARSLREKALIQEWKETEESIIKERISYEEEEIKKQEVTEKELHFHLERLKTAIREDTLDEAIEKSLGVTVDYNYAIDRTGNFYFGRLNSNTPMGKDEKSEITSN